MQTVTIKNLTKKFGSTVAIDNLSLNIERGKPKAGPCMIKSWDYDPTPYWGEFARRALSGEKFEMKRMR